MYLAPEHQKLAAKLGDKLAEIEHFREPSPNGYDRDDHHAAVVLKDGSCYFGHAICSPKDQYSHKRGYTIAVGRALKKAVVQTDRQSVPITLSKRNLRDYIHRMIFNTIHTSGSSRALDTDNLGVKPRLRITHPSLREEKLGGGQSKKIDGLVEHYTLPADIYHFRCPNCNNDHPKSDMGGICKKNNRILMYAWSTFNVTELKAMLQKWRDTESEARVQADLIEELLMYNE